MERMNQICLAENYAGETVQRGGVVGDEAVQQTGPIFLHELQIGSCKFITFFQESTGANTC